MREKVILITGAVGEIGQALVTELGKNGANTLLTLDIKKLPDDIAKSVIHVEGDILDRALLARLVSEYEIDVIYHLAALLSTRAEFTPELAHRVNVDGTMNLVQLAAEQSERRDSPVRFIFPSSIAAYGLPSLAIKERDHSVKEYEWNNPTTMYGCNKLYCELLGSYYSSYYHQLEKHKPTRLDFRSLRFPGLISAFTMPSGGTSDYAPEMIHAAAKGVPYQCFVREDTKIPFMAMPDAIGALLYLAEAPASELKRRVYNVTSFSLTAGAIRDVVVKAFPEAKIQFAPDEKRQGIVDTWPAELNDLAARQDWGWNPQYAVEEAFNDYLIPNINYRYKK